MTLALEARAKADDVIIGDTPKAKQRRKRLAGLTPAGRLWKNSTLRDIDGSVETSAMQDLFYHRAQSVGPHGQLLSLGARTKF